RVQRAQDTHQLDRFLPKGPSLSFGADDALKDFKELWVLEIRLEHVSGVACQLSEGIERGLTLHVGALILQSIQHERHESILVGKHVFAANRGELSDRLQNRCSNRW